MRKKRLPLSEAEKKGYRAWVRNRALLELFIRHPDKANDEKTIKLVTDMARLTADAKIAIREGTADDATKSPT